MAEPPLAEWVTNRREPVPSQLLPDAYRALLAHAERENCLREGLAETPQRAARAWGELTRGYSVDVAGLFSTFDADGYDELVVVKDIPFFSLCEHHLLPFHGTISLAYVPDGRIVGLSKVARLVDAFARRLQVQERMTAQIADVFDEHVRPAGVAVVANAVHLCMAMRGVKVAASSTTTSALRGSLRTEQAQRAEVLALLR